MNLGNIKFALITLFALSLLVTTSAGFSVSGSILKTEVNPGQEVVHVMTVKNGEDALPLLDLTAEVFGFGISPTGGNLKFSSEEDTSPYSARAFFEVSPNKFSLGPGESQEVVLEGRIPEDVGSGGRYAVVNIKTEPMGSGNVGVITAIDVPIMLTIKGSELTETGEITDIKVLENDDGLFALLMFENIGNHHYKASSEAVIKDESGEVVAEVSTVVDASSILPENVRQFKIQLDQETDLAPGTYTVDVSVIKEDGTVLDTEEATFEV